MLLGRTGGEGVGGDGDEGVGCVRGETFGAVVVKAGEELCTESHGEIPRRFFREKVGSDLDGKGKRSRDKSRFFFFRMLHLGFPLDREDDAFEADAVEDP